MDDGYEIPCLNEGYTLGGAKVMEWAAGLVMAMMISELFCTKPTRSAPILIVVLMCTTMGLAMLRRQYPDEERGLRNQVMVWMGLTPPGLPAPSTIQPYWSGAPVRQLPEMGNYTQLGLEGVFPKQDQEEDEVT